MATYAILWDGAFREWKDFDVLPPHRPGSILPQVVDPLPSFNTATEKAIEATPIVEASQVRKTWVVVPLSSAELLEKAIGVDLEQARQVYTALKNGSGTDAARLRRVEAVLAGILRYIATKEGYIVQ